MIQGVLTKEFGLWGAMGGVSELGGQCSERRLSVLLGHRGREDQRGSLMPPTPLAYLMLGPGGLPRAHRGWVGGILRLHPMSPRPHVAGRGHLPGFLLPPSSLASQCRAPSSLLRWE